MYHGVIIEESLGDRSVLDDVVIVGTEVEEVTEGFGTPWVERWTLRSVEIEDEKIEGVADRVAEAIDKEHAGSWFADFENGERRVIVFSERVFAVDRSKGEGYDEVKRYALNIGIPEHQLGFLKER